MTMWRYGPRAVRRLPRILGGAIGIAVIAAGTWLVFRSAKTGSEPSGPSAASGSPGTVDEPRPRMEYPGAWHAGRKRDEIAAVDRPIFAPVPPPSADLSDDDWVVGIERNGVARAYPLWILAKREIVNDRFGDDPVCVTYCPLSASAAVFLARVRGEPAVFGNEGSLFECNLVLYDRGTGSLWYQLRGEAIEGAWRGERLTQLPGYVTPWGSWRIRHANTTVLVADGHSGRFFRVATGTSAAEEVAAPTPQAPVSRTNARFASMERVVGAGFAGSTPGTTIRVCFPEASLRALAAGDYPVPGVPNGVLRVDARRRTWAFLGEGREVPWIGGYWFAWHAAYPEAEFPELRAAESQGTGSTR